jgi:hypothetical protein
MGEPMSAFVLTTLSFMYWFELIFVEAVCGPEFSSLCDKFSKLRGHFVRLTEGAHHRPLSSDNGNCNVLIIGAKPVHDVSKCTDQYLTARIARGTVTPIGSGEQREVERFAIRSINQSRFFVRADEATLTVGTGCEVLLQGQSSGSPNSVARSTGTPGEGRCSTSLEPVRAATESKRAEQGMTVGPGCSYEAVSRQPNAPTLVLGYPRVKYSGEPMTPGAVGMLLSASLAPIAKSVFNHQEAV